jgi:hypothetical protein
MQKLAPARLKFLGMITKLFLHQTKPESHITACYSVETCSIGVFKLLKFVIPMARLIFAAQKNTSRLNKVRILVKGPDSDWIACLTLGCKLYLSKAI